MKFQKTALLEVLEERDNSYFVQNEGDSSDQWEIPKETFKSTYVEYKQDFGWAIRQLKDGKRVGRKGWNGKGMFLYYVPAASYFPSTSIAYNAFDGKPVPYGAYIAMKTAQNNVVPWLASQTDMLAEDWVII